jgi:hypothetical protein
MTSFLVSDRAAGATGSEEIMASNSCVKKGLCQVIDSRSHGISVLTSVTSSFIITMTCSHVSSTTHFSETRLRWLVLTVEVARPLMSKLERVKGVKAENFMVALV